MMTIVVVSVIFTLIVLVLSIMTLTEGYGYKHTIDPLTKDEEENDGLEQVKQTDEDDQ